MNTPLSWELDFDHCVVRVVGDAQSEPNRWGLPGVATAVDAPSIDIDLQDWVSSNMF